MKTVRLEVKIPSPTTVTVPTPILDMWQEADVVSVASSTGPTNGLSATKSSRVPSSFFSQHPRVRLTSPAKKRAGGVAVLNLDLRFLNVTAYATSLTGRGFDDFSTTSHQCKWFVFAHTQGIPLVWAVGVPDAIDQGDPGVNALLFFSHELKTHMVQSRLGTWGPHAGGYTTVESARYDRISKYVNNSGAMGDGQPHYFSGSPSSLLFDSDPPFNWDQQLAQSQKKVLYVMPLPQGAAGATFGAADSAANARAILSSLLLALQSEDVVARTAMYVTLKRLAIGGWSSGMVTVVNWLDTDAAGIVDEAYLFDGESVTVAPRLQADIAKGCPQMRAWLTKKLPATRAGDGKRLLRMIGTAYTEVEYNGIFAALKSASDVKCWPNNTSYWYNDGVYLRALTKTGETAIEHFDTLGSAATAAATVLTNVFFVTENKTTGSLQLGSTGLTSRTLAGAVGHAEAATMMHYRFVAKTASSQSTFDDICTTLVTSVVGQGDEKNSVRRVLRHSWAVIGASPGPWTDPGTGPPIVGFFQQCLEASKFV